MQCNAFLHSVKKPFDSIFHIVHHIAMQYLAFLHSVEKALISFGEAARTAYHNVVSFDVCYISVQCKSAL